MHVPGARLSGPPAAAAIASPSQEHCGSPEVLEQIYRCNPILRYTSSPLYAPLLPFPYGSLDQSGEGLVGVLRPGLAGAMAGPGWALSDPSAGTAAGAGRLGKPTGLLTPILSRSPRPPQLHHAA